MPALVFEKWYYAWTNPLQKLVVVQMRDKLTGSVYSVEFMHISDDETMAQITFWMDYCAEYEASEPYSWETGDTWYEIAECSITEVWERGYQHWSVNLTVVFTVNTPQRIRDKCERVWREERKKVSVYAASLAEAKATLQDYIAYFG